MSTNMDIKMKRNIKDYLTITFGLILYALAFTVFLLPYKLTTGGVTGIATIIYYSTGLEIQNVYFVVNVLFLVVALKILGLKFLMKTIYAVFVVTFLL